jgi:hypothetical protein
MFVADLFVALVVALLIGLVFFVIMGRSPWKGFFWAFLAIFLFSWAAGVWIRPFGPSIWGVTWLPFLVFGFLLALIIAATVPPRPRRPGPDVLERGEAASEPDATHVAVGVFFWVLLLGLLVALVGHYVYRI